MLVAFSPGSQPLHERYLPDRARRPLRADFRLRRQRDGRADPLSSDYENVAASLGASPLFRLRHVTLPMIAPYMISAFALSLSLSMGELGATMMIYPPSWTTLPVTIFSLTDRGSIANGATLTMILVAATLLLMLVLERIAHRLTPGAK